MLNLPADGDRAALPASATGTRPAALSRLRPWQMDLLRQAAVIGAGGAAYALTFTVLAWVFTAAEQRQLAIANAAMIVRFERWLHIADEADVQRFAVQHLWLGRMCDITYMWLHLPLIVALAVWLYTRHRPVFVRARDAMLIAGLIALACEFWPVAPPHLLPDLGVVNTAASRTYDVVEPKGFFDSYGAVPSIHVAWALLVTVAVWQASRARWLRLPALLLPGLMTLAVVATGNHYWFDAATGVIAALVGLWAASGGARGLSGLRGRRWRRSSDFP